MFGPVPEPSAACVPEQRRYGPTMIPVGEAARCIRRNRWDIPIADFLSRGVRVAQGRRVVGSNWTETGAVASRTVLMYVNDQQTKTSAEMIMVVSEKDGRDLDCSTTRQGDGIRPVKIARHDICRHPHDTSFVAYETINAGTCKWYFLPHHQTISIYLLTSLRSSQQIDISRPRNKRRKRKKRNRRRKTHQSVTASSHNLTSCSLVPAK